MIERGFRAMGSDVHVVVAGDEGLADRARARIDLLERRWSRFLPDSEISRLNATPGVPVIVSPDTLGLIAHAVEAWRLTDGAFDPSLLHELRAAGYDRSFELLEGTAPGSPVPERRAGCEAIIVEPGVGAVTLPRGVGFDPGGIGKGYAADLVADEVMAAGARGVSVSIGGDVRVAGVPDDADAWLIDVAHPSDASPIMRLAVADGAVVTTSRARRTWTTDGVERHHLLDPATRAPAFTGIVQVTVVAGDGWVAEAFAKAAFLAGEAAAERLRALGATGVVVADDGGVRLVPGIEEFAA